jgi:Leucine rich repeat
VSGTIPTELGQLTELWEVDLSMNRLNGTIPTELGLLSSSLFQTLSSLWLHQNELVGTVPSELSALTELTSLRLSDNALTGSIASELAGLGALKELWLAGNRIGGTVPAVVCEMLSRPEVCSQDDLAVCDLEPLLLLAIDCDRVVCSCPRNCTCGTT